MRQLDERERCDWLQLIRTPTIGPITFHRLIAKYQTAADAIQALPELSRNSRRRSALTLADRAATENEIERADEFGVRIIASCEPDYPAPLRATPGHPPALYVKGHVSLFEKPAIAIIGARNASGIGRKFARSLANDLGAEGVVVVSGLARGIDGAAHDAALATGTIAVVAGGVDVIYPPEHEELTHRIANQGALVSECAMGSKPTARDFPKRNRIISGLSAGVIVVEAATRSGTLITARYALEQGREVFAVPGSPLDPRCQGANKLISEGATLVQSANDILDVLAEQSRGAREDERNLFDWQQPGAEADPIEMQRIQSQVLELLGFTPLHRDELLREIGASPGQLADALLTLVLSGEAVEHTGARFSRASD